MQFDIDGNDDVQGCDEMLNSLIQENYATKKTEEHLAPPVSDLLAKTIDDWALQVPNKPDIKLAFEQCCIPVNVRSLSPVKINDIIFQHIIFQHLPFKAKEADRHAKNNSSYYTRAMGPLTYIWDTFIKAEVWAMKHKAAPPHIKVQGDTVPLKMPTACLSASIKILCFHTAINLQRRKSALHQFLDHKYLTLASSTNPVTSYLFGDNLEQRVSDIFKISQAAHNSKFQAVRGHTKSFFSRNQNRGTFK